MDATTLEELFRKVGLLRDVAETVPGGKVLTLLDLPRKLPIHVWMDENPMANEESFLDELMESSAYVRDSIISMGQYRSNPCSHPVRLVEVYVAGVWACPHH